MNVTITTSAIFVPASTFTATGLSLTLLAAPRVPVGPATGDLGVCEDCGGDMDCLLSNPNVIFCEWCEFGPGV